MTSINTEELVQLAKDAQQRHGALLYILSRMYEARMTDLNPLSEDEVEFLSDLNDVITDHREQLAAGRTRLHQMILDD